MSIFCSTAYSCSSGVAVVSSVKMSIYIRLPTKQSLYCLCLGESQVVKSYFFLLEQTALQLIKLIKQVFKPRHTIG